jgi:hypothetical protein
VYDGREAYGSGSRKKTKKIEKYLFLLKQQDIVCMDNKGSFENPGWVFGTFIRKWKFLRIKDDKGRA